MFFTYWSNKTTYHEAKLFEVEATCLTDADKTCKEHTGFDPAKTNWISLGVRHEVKRP